MHTPRCPELLPRGSMDTIVSPRGGQQMTAQNGVLQSAGVRTSRNFAVCVSILPSAVAAAQGPAAVVRLVYADGVCDFGVGQHPVTRIIPAEDVQDVQVTSDGGARVWVEDLSTLDKHE